MRASLCRFVVATLCVAFVVPGCCPCPTNTGDESTMYDIGVMAEGSTATLVSEGVYQIVLTNVHNNAIAFTESPDRTAKTFALEGLGMWKKMFPNEPPNAVLYGRTPTDDDIVVFEMGQPTYDPNAATLTFQATLVGDSPAPAATMDDVDLLIDPTAGQWINIAWSCGTDVITLVAAAVEAGANPLADVGAIGATAKCVSAIAAADW